MNCLHEKGGITEPAVHCLDGTGARKHVLFPAQPSTLPAFIPVLHTCQHALDAFIHTHTHTRTHPSARVRHTHTHTSAPPRRRCKTHTHTHTLTPRVASKTHTHTHTRTHTPCCVGTTHTHTHVNTPINTLSYTHLENPPRRAKTSVTD